ncbi:MAG: hypothetical protein J6A15_07755 [Clostridia bacterium]|nr:hypothetical protein [Clostridia bacterium]
MGIFDKVISNISGRDYNVNDQLATSYGPKQVTETYKEVSKTLRKKTKESVTLNDQILEKYNKKNKEDVQNNLMKKYLKLSRDDLNQQEIAKKELEKHQIEDEVDKTLEGTDKVTREQVKKDLLEDEQIDTGKKDKKQELQARIYKATYTRMYNDYTNSVLKIKDSQFDKMEIAISEAQAIEMIAMEKNLENIELKYNKATGKDFSKDKNIREKREEFKQKFEYNQRGINSITENIGDKINRLYAIREEKHRQYMKALMDKNISSQEIAYYKREYQEANLELMQKVPSLQEYTKDLEVQEKNEQMAKEAKVENKSAVNNKIDNRHFDDTKNVSEKVTDSKMVEHLDKVQEKEEKRDERNFETISKIQKDELEKGNLDVAKEIGDLQSTKRIYDENIEKTPNQPTPSQAQKEVERNQEISDDSFFSTLRSGVNDMNDIKQEDIERVEKIAKEEIGKKAYNEQKQQLNEQYQRERRKKTSNN